MTINKKGQRKIRLLKIYQVVLSVMMEKAKKTEGKCGGGTGKKAVTGMEGGEVRETSGQGEWTVKIQGRKATCGDGLMMNQEVRNK